MCGRFSIYEDKKLRTQFDVELAHGAFRANYDVRPTTPIIGIAEGDFGGGALPRFAALYRWGLVPGWKGDLRHTPFNAKAETVRTNGMFRSAFKKRRLIVPANGFYEWRAEGGRKVPYHFARTDGNLIAFAGLWEEKFANGDTPDLLSCTIITTDAGADVADVHDRMPVILEEDVWELWMDPGSDLDEVHSLLRPAPADTLCREQLAPS